MMRPMDTAPQDGTRILIKRHVHHFRHDWGYVRVGTQWVECRWHEGKWSEWCGNERTTSTCHIDAIGWTEVPA